MIAQHRAFVARRRAERPNEEYRELTAAEWDHFLAHFELRKAALGPAAEGFGNVFVTQRPTASSKPGDVAPLPGP